MDHPLLEKLAVIVAARDEEASIEACLKSIRRATASATEIYLVDDNSADRTRYLAEQLHLENLCIVMGEGRGPGLARNMAVAKTQKPYIAFVDADAYVNASAFIELLQEFNVSDPNVVGVGGVQHVRENACPREKEVSAFLNAIGGVSDYLGAGDTPAEVAHNPSCLVMYRREDFVALGGFNPHLWPCEDLELDIRFGKAHYRLRKNPRAKVFHKREASYISLIKMMYRYGYGHAQLIRLHGFCQFIHGIPIFLVIFYVIFGFAYAQLSFTQILTASACGYFLTGFYFISRGLGKTAALKAPFILFAIIHSWTLGLLSGFMYKGIAKHE